MAPVHGKFRDPETGVFGHPEDFRVKDHAVQFLQAKKALSSGFCKHFEPALGVFVENPQICHLDQVVEFGGKFPKKILMICDHCAVELELVSREPLLVQVFEEEEK